MPGTKVYIRAGRRPVSPNEKRFSGSSAHQSLVGNVRLNLASVFRYNPFTQLQVFAMYAATIGARRYTFHDLRTLLARASPLRSGDALAGVAAATGEERVAAQAALAELPLATFLRADVVPYETDEVTRLIIDTHDPAAFAPVAHLTVGGFRDWLLSDEATPPALAALAPGVTPEMAAAVSKISRLQDLMVMAARCSVVARFRNTVGLPGRLSVRLQPNHPTDDP